MKISGRIVLYTEIQIRIKWSGAEARSGGEMTHIKAIMIERVFTKREVLYALYCIGGRDCEIECYDDPCGVVYY